MKKVYIVHCWEGTCKDGWYPWLDTQLSNDNVTVIRFDMPDTKHPNIEKWLAELDKQVATLDQDTYFIGHSIGCQTILRYLETKEITSIGGILFVAPWLDLLPEAVADEESFNTAYPWIHTRIDFGKIKQFTNNITCIFSDDDYFVSLSQENEFKEKLNAKTVIVKDKGHISQEDGVYELEELLDLSRKMIEINEE